MDEKARARLAELEEMEQRWMEANRVFKCHGCGVDLGRVEFDSAPPDPSNGFRRGAPIELRVRRGPVRAPGGTPRQICDTEHEIKAILQDGTPIQPATNLEWPPAYIDIRKQGIKCEDCGRRIEPGTLDQLVAPFRYASELARLRLRAHSACVQSCDAT